MHYHLYKALGTMLSNSGIVWGSKGG